MKIDKKVSLFIDYVKNQFEYGGKKYAHNDKKESTDCLFDDFGKGWLFGTMAKYCYDEKTEILTDEGWKYFKDLNKKEKVATLNPETKEIEYQKPEDYQAYEYNLPYIYSVNSKYIDMKVTPFHQIYYRTRNSKYKLGDISDIVHAPKGRYYFKLLAENGIQDNLENLSTFTLPHVKNLSRPDIEQKYDIENWLEFLGWYLSEGNIYYYKKQGRYNVFIAQLKQPHRQSIKFLLNKMNINFCTVKNGMSIQNKTLYSYLKQFGKSQDKFIPLKMKNLSQSKLKILLNTLIKGDGHIKEKNNKKYYSYFSISKQLADDVQEIALKCGYSSQLAEQNGGYCVYFWKHPETLVKELEKEKLTKPIKVYDVTVPKHHILLVRRNGKAYWNGNCKRWQNLARERDMLKIACYCFILWLKRGFHIDKRRIAPINTTVDVKSKYFPVFIEKAKKELVTALDQQEFEKLHYATVMPNAEELYVKLKKVGQISFHSISEDKIYDLLTHCFLLWHNEIPDNEKGKDQDVKNKTDRK